MISLWFVRHGETDWNTEGRVQGWTDIPLNERGESQAQELGKSLQLTKFESIVASDLNRARRTAEIVAAYVKAPIHINAQLRERSFGSAEGRIRAEAEAFFKGDAPDAERLEIIDKRAETFLADMTRTYRDGRILCVTHGGFIRAILRAIFALDVESPPNTSVTRIDWDGESWSLIEFGSVRHLEQIEQQSGE